MPRARNGPNAVTPLEQIWHEFFQIESSVGFNSIHLPIFTVFKAVSGLTFSETVDIKTLDNELIIARFNEKQRFSESRVGPFDQQTLPYFLTSQQLRTLFVGWKFILICKFDHYFKRIQIVARSRNT